MRKYNRLGKTIVPTIPGTVTAQDIRETIEDAKLHPEKYPHFSPERLAEAITGFEMITDKSRWPKIISAKSST